MNIAKTGFFIPLKGHKSNTAFANFYYSSYRDDFYIFIPAKPLKAKPNKPNVSEGVISKLGPYRPKNRQWSEVLEGVDIKNNNFKDSSSWESIEGGLRVSEDRSCEPVES